MDTKKFKCGLKPSKHTQHDNTTYKFSILDYKQVLPEEYSLKDKMVKFIQEHQDCASVSTIRHVMCLKDIKDQLSVLYQYHYARKLDGTENMDDGSSIDHNMMAVISYGYVNDQVFEYKDKNVFIEPNKLVVDIGNKHAREFKGYRKLLQSLWNLKYVVSILKKPIVYGSKIFHSFFNLDENNCVPLPSNEEKNNDNGLVGLHAMVIIGYNDKEQKFEIQNSWDFGNANGQHFIPYSYVLDHSLSFDFFILEN